MKLHFRMLFLAAGVLIALGGPCLAADVRGTVKSIDAPKKLLIVTTKTDQEVRVKLTDDTRIEDARGEKLDVAAIQAGSAVVVREAVEATDIVVKPRLKGVVKSVDVGAKKVVVAEDQGNAPALYLRV